MIVNPSPFPSITPTTFTSDYPSNKTNDFSSVIAEFLDGYLRSYFPKEYSFVHTNVSQE